VLYVLHGPSFSFLRISTTRGHHSMVWFFFDSISNPLQAHSVPYFVSGPGFSLPPGLDIVDFAVTRLTGRHRVSHKRHYPIDEFSPIVTVPTCRNGYVKHCEKVVEIVNNSGCFLIWDSFSPRIFREMVNDEKEVE
jgi:hypothetical protein